MHYTVKAVQIETFLVALDTALLIASAWKFFYINKFHIDKGVHGQKGDRPFRRQTTTANAKTATG